jgi:uncharacterized damage-inducible protein DinB
VNADYFRFLYDYLYWARDKVLTAAEGMTDEDFGRDNGFTYKSLRGILVHALAGEAMWCARVRGDQPGPFLSEDAVPTVSALREAWREAESKQRAYLDKMTDADVAADVVFAGRDGVERRIPRWQLLTLVFHHTVQHRSEAAEALTMIGRSPGDMDLLVYTREVAERQR